MRWLAALLVPCVAWAQTVNVVELAVEPAGVRVSAAYAAAGTPTAYHAGFDERELAAGTRWFEVLGDAESVLARGLLPSAGARLEAEEPALSALLSLESAVPITVVQVRVPAINQPRQVALYEKPRTRLALLPVATTAAGAPVNLQQTQIHGTQTTNRAHVLLVPEGFPPEGVAPGSRLQPECEKLVAALRDQKPFDRYAHLLAVSVVRAASNESGVSQEGEPLRDTALGMVAMDARDGDKVVQFDDGTPRWRWISLQLPAEGFGRLLRINLESAPQVRVALANTAEWTGTALAARSPSPVVLMGLGLRDWRFVHMLGHTLGGLSDDVAAHPVGACVMRRDPLAEGFCETCQASIVEALYDRVHLVDATEPAARVLAVDGTAPPTFKVTLNATARQELRAQWSFDNQPCEPAGTALAFTPKPELWKPGHHVVRFQVSDKGPIRSFPHEVRWDVHVRASGIAPLELAGEPF